MRVGAPQAPLELRDGDVVTATWDPSRPPQRYGVEELFVEGATWGPLHHFPAVEASDACTLS